MPKKRNTVNLEENVLWQEVETRLYFLFLNYENVSIKEMSGKIRHLRTIANEKKNEFKALKPRRKKNESNSY